MDRKLHLLVNVLAGLALGLGPMAFAASPSFARQQTLSSEAPAVVQLVREGSGLSRQEVERLEESLKSNPEDLAARARLLGYYFASSLRVSGPDATIQARRGHILWIIRNHPEAEIAGLSQATIDPSGHPLADKAGYAQAREAWLQQVESHKQIPAVMANAAKFFLLPDKELAETTLRRGQALEPGNREWSSKLGYVYALGILGVTGMNQNGLCTDADPQEAGGTFAAKARKELEASSDAMVVGVAGRQLYFCGATLRAFKKVEADPTVLAERLLQRAHALAPEDSNWPSWLNQLYKLRSSTAASPEERTMLQKKALALLEETDRARPKAERDLNQLTELARAAIEAGEVKKAEMYSNELLEMASQRQADGMYGTAVHHGNLVLGRIALRQGDLETAKAYLLKAGKTPGGGTLTSFGPNMSLAKELLEHGERDAVLGYFAECKVFWKNPRLDQWTQMVRDGQTPNFGANLVY
jgi:hypothetical protein